MVWGTSGILDDYVVRVAIARKTVYGKGRWVNRPASPPQTWRTWAERERQRWQALRPRLARQSPLVLDALARQYEQMAQEIRALLAARQAGAPEGPADPSAPA